MVVVVLLFMASLKPSHEHATWNGLRGLHRTCPMTVGWWKLHNLRLPFISLGSFDWREHTLVMEIPCAMHPPDSPNLGRNPLTGLL